MGNEVFINLIGTVAAILTTSAFLPQAVKTIKHKSTKDISLIMYVVLVAGIIFWIIYGFLLNAMPIILANSITFILAFTVLVLKIKYK